MRAATLYCLKRKSAGLFALGRGEESFLSGAQATWAILRAAQSSLGLRQIFRLFASHLAEPPELQGNVPSRLENFIACDWLIV